MAKLTQKQKEFLKNPYVGAVTTLREDGSPHSTVVWVDDEENGDVSFNTAYGRLKPTNLERDPRVSLLVLDPNDSYKWIAFDGTGRLQTVHKETNPRYYRLIEHFRDLTGIPLVLNTSFNENEPVVCYPEEALDCFLRTEMDLLVLGNFWVERGR